MKILILVLMFILADVITGLIKAIIGGSFTSSCMRKGLIHKVGEILCVLFGYMCEYAFPNLGIQIDIPIVNTICIYLILMETGSIIENLSYISPGVAAVVKSVFGSYIDKNRPEVNGEPVENFENNSEEK